MAISCVGWVWMRLLRLRPAMTRAKAVNFAKLMNNVAYELDLKEDPARRSESEHWQEIVKFISYLRELDVFEGS